MTRPAPLDPRTHLVQTLYSHLPFPCPAPADAPLDDVATYLRAFSRENRVDLAEASILDAGCGTGDRTAAVADAFPGANVVGVDLCAASLERAAARWPDARPNLRFARANLLEPLPVDPVDLVIATGSLHHTADPVLAARNIGRALRPDGALLLWVYGALGEHDRMVHRELVRSLVTDPADIEDGLRVVDALSLHVDAARYGECYGRASVTETVQRAVDADALLNEIVECYRAADIAAWLAAAGFSSLALCGVTTWAARATLRCRYAPPEPGEADLHPAYVDMRASLGDGLHDRFLALPVADKQRVIELVHRPVGYTVLAWKQDRPPLGPRLTAGLLELS